MNEQERREWRRIVHGDRDDARRRGLVLLLAYFGGLVAIVGHVAGWW